MAVIAVDAGTTMIKAVAYDDEGREVAVVRQPTLVKHPQPGWAEQDMREVWDAVASTVDRVRASVTGEVHYLALTAQGDGCWLVDSDGAPTGPAILWNDGRGAPFVARWQAEGRLAEAFGVNGSQNFPGLPNAILAWLHDNDADRLERSHHALTCGGWLFSRLTGVSAIDESDAAVPFMDIKSRTYSDQLFALFDLEWARRLLPPVLAGGDRLSVLGPEAARQMGLPAGLPVVLSSYDIASTAIGVGAVEPGQACSILGTTLCTEIVASSARTTGTPTGLTVPLGVGDLYLSAFPTLAGGEVIQWACEMLGIEDAGDLADLAGAAPPGGGGLIFLPYLSPAGERVPFLDTAARGSLLGLSLVHGRGDLARAVFEGLTFVIRECLEASGVHPTDLRVCGGGAASDFWLQLIADITHVPVSRSADSEVGAKGAFLLGQVATGRSSDIQSAAEKFIRVRDTFAPDPDRGRLYDSRFAAFLAARLAVRETWGSGTHDDGSRKAGDDGRSALDSTIRSAAGAVE